MSRSPLDDLLLACETSLLDPRVRSSRDRASALLAPDFIEIGSSGCIYTREDVIGQMSNEEPLDQKIEAFSARELSPGVVLVCYTLIRNARVHSLRSSIWKLRDGAWRMVFHQGTRTATHTC